jgi:sugar-specific transcriptional regulator TrmB
LSRDTVLRILTQIGLPKRDVEVYLFLAIEGPKKPEDIANSLQMSLFDLQNILKRLQERGLVAAVPLNFVALPLQKLLDTFVKTRLQEAQEIEEKKRIIIAHWHSLVYRATKR